MLVQSSALHSDELLARVDSVIGDRLSATHSTSRGYGLVEISARGVDKGAMLGAGLSSGWASTPPTSPPSATCPTTCRMLSWVGQPYVVANAHPALLEQGFPTRAAEHRVRRRADDPPAAGLRQRCVR